MVFGKGVSNKIGMLPKICYAGMPMEKQKVLAVNLALVGCRIKTVFEYKNMRHFYRKLLDLFE